MRVKWVLENCTTTTLYIDNTTNLKRDPVDNADDGDEILYISYFGRIGPK